MNALDKKARTFGATEFGLSKTKNKRFYVIYNNTKINFILTSDTMRFMDGLKCREVMNEIFIEKKIKNIPIFLLIDEKDKISDLNCLSNSFKKPLNEQIIEVILNSIYE